MSTADPTAAESGVMPGDGQTSHEIVKRARGEQYAVEVMPLMTDDEIRRTWRTASALAASRMFKDALQAEQAFAKILLGRDLGLSPTQALTGIHIVEGKPEIAAVTLASFVRRRSDTRYEVVEQTNDACEIHFYAGERTSDTVVAEHHSQSCPRHAASIHGTVQCSCRPSHEFEGEEYRGPSRFDNADMELAELNKATRNGAKSNHTKYPRNMKFARAMSNGTKWLVPEAIGGIPVYVEGEVQQAAIDAPRQVAEELRALPEVLAGLLERTQRVDGRAWRRNEILARLPHPDAPEFQPAVDGVAAEMAAWLAEHDPPDAEVVGGEPEQSLEQVDGDAPADPEQLRAQLQARYDADPGWREQVDVLLSRYADLENADPDESQAADVTAELEAIEGDLDALGVPVGWYPVSQDQPELGL